MCACVYKFTSIEHIVLTYFDNVICVFHKAISMLPQRADYLNLDEAPAMGNLNTTVSLGDEVHQEAVKKGKKMK